MSDPHWMDGMTIQNETEEDFELVEEKCEWCDGTGECPVYEYSKEGQLIGVGTLTKKCICRMNGDHAPEGDYSSANEEV